MRHASIVLVTGRDKVLTYGIFALIARDGLNSIILNCGSNRLVEKFVASARGKGFRATAVRILARRFIRKAKNLFSHNFIEHAVYQHSSVISFLLLVPNEGLDQKFCYGTAN
jgi:hypothetical protein